MILDAVTGNSQWLDGGAMFGNCPRALWETWCPPDEHNRIALGCRALLVRDAGRTVLFEAGIGAFFSPELRARYGVREEGHVLIDSLAALGVAPEDVDVVVLSHLHFDHAGGILTAWRTGEPPALAFPNAHYVAGRAAWERACRPHPRDRASFIPELPALLVQTGRLEIVHGEHSWTLGPGFRFRASDGHSPGMLLTEIETPRGPLVFVADLIPALPWVHLPITMGYDRHPELVIDEKRTLLERVAADGGWLFFTHDPVIPAARVRSEGGRFHAREPQRTLHWNGAAS